MNFFEILAGLLCFTAKQIKSSISSDGIIYSYIRCGGETKWDS